MNRFDDVGALSSERIDRLLGSTLDGRYRLDRTLGVGGVGVVYGASHLQLGRPVAVKVLGAAWASDDVAVRRFEREARALSLLRHSNIVDVFDFGCTEDGRPYLVMEWLEGQTLADYLDTKLPLSPTETAGIVSDIAGALDAVHAAGVVHRDIKPENLFLAVDPSGETALKVIDFGLVGLLFEGNQPRLTRDGLLYGTPEYMPPEVTEQDHIDQRADVYALAVTAFEMIAGDLPFQGGSPFRLLTEKRDRRAPRLSDVSRIVFSPALEAVFQRALQRRPADRFHSAGAFAEALEAAVRRGDAVEAVVRTTSTQPGPMEEEDVTVVPGLRPRRSKLWVSLAALLVVAGVVWWTVPLLQTGPSGAPVASAPMEEEVRAPTESASVPGAAAEAPAGSPAEVVAAPEVSTEVGSQSPRVVPRRPRPHNRRERPPARSAAVERPDEALSFDPPEPRRRASEQTSGAESERATTDEDRTAARERTRQGYLHMARGRLPDAITEFRAALNRAPSAGAIRGLGLANERLGRVPEARRAYERYIRAAPGAADADAIRERLNSLR